MLTETEVRGLINDVFEEEALLIGGLVAVHQLDDALVWRLVKHLSVPKTSSLVQAAPRAPSRHDAQEAMSLSTRAWAGAIDRRRSIEASGKAGWTQFSLGC